MTPSDPAECLTPLVIHASKMSDEELLTRLQVGIERLRNTIRSIAPEANITDRFEGIESAAVAVVLKERHG